MCQDNTSVWIKTSKNKELHTQCGINIWDQFTCQGERSQQFGLNRKFGQTGKSL